MAAEMEVELSNIGKFTDEGLLEVRYNQRKIAYLSLDFLHDGVPRKTLEAQWVKPDLYEPELPDSLDYNDIGMQEQRYAVS